MHPILKAPARAGGAVTARQSIEEVKNMQVYKQHPGPDDYVGRVEGNGRVYGQRFGPDEYLGRVENNGRVYAHVPGGPDRYLGRVQRDGEIYRHVPGGPDKEVGHVDKNGKIYLRRRGPASDDLVGRVEGDDAEVHLAGAAAFFLLLLEAE
jgi:hypothetical protein